MTRTRNPWLVLLALLMLTATLLSVSMSPAAAADPKDVALFSWHNSVASPDEDTAPAGNSAANDGACTDVLQEDQVIRQAILDQGSTVTILGVDPRDDANADDWSAVLATVDTLVIPELNSCTFAVGIVDVIESFVEAGGTLVMAAAGDTSLLAIANAIMESSITGGPSSPDYSRQEPLASEPSAPATITSISRTAPVSAASLPAEAETWYATGDGAAVWRAEAGSGSVYGFGWDWFPNGQDELIAEWNTVLSLVAAGTIVSTPSIAYAPTTIDAEVGTAISPLSPTNSGGATDSWSVAPALPAGLTIDTGNGVISGTPTAAATSADYTVTATNTAGSDTFVLTITVAAGPKVATTVELTASATTVLVGDPVELTATVDGNDPTGTVEFFDGSSSLGTATLPSPAVLTTSSLAIGSHSITAVYEGDDANESASTPAPLELTVVPVPSAEVDTTTPTAGDTLSVTGEGFQPGSDVTIALGDDSTVLGSVAVADDGTFSIDIALPDDVDGDQPLTISGTDQTGGSTSIVFGLTIEAILPAAGYSTETLTLVAVFLLAAGALILSRSRRREA